MSIVDSMAFIKRFRFWSTLTIVSVYLLILVGGIVRATGSGMGCPDWPRCFGQWVPPTQASQLPPNYRQVYTAQRVAKNQKLARTLERLGFKQVAGEIFSHPTQYIETDFNAVKTWIEYLNRLLGALIGIFVFVTAVVALPYWRHDQPVFWLAVASWLLTGVQGWLGSLVVSTNLLPVMVTVHMGLALVIVALLLYAIHRARYGRREQLELDEAVELETTDEQQDDETPAVSTGLRWLVGGLLLLSFVQITIGTQVREQIDLLAAANSYANRATWVDQLGSIFESHRTLAALLVLANVVVGYLLWQLNEPVVNKLLGWVGGLLLLETTAGISLAALGLPAWMQPVHLTVATLLFGVQFLLLLALRRLSSSATEQVAQAASSAAA